jgi:signal transduction histidine kinase
MGTHGAGSTRPRALPSAERATEPAGDSARAPRPGANSRRGLSLNLTDWPVARRLFAVIVAALLMGVIFGGLRVADSEASASQFSQVSQLANLGAKLTVLVDALQNERDQTLLLLSGSQNVDQNSVKPLYATTRGAAAVVLAAANIGGLPSNIQADVTTATADIRPARLAVLQSTLNPDQPQQELSVIANYGATINDMITLADQVSQGVSDAALASDVRALNELALAKEQASQQRALLNYSFTAQTTSGSGKSAVVVVDENTEQALTVAYHQEFVDEAGFQQAATPAELASFASALTAKRAAKAVGVVEDIEQSVFALNNADSGVSGSPLLGSVQGTITLGTNGALVPIGGTVTFVGSGSGANAVSTATAHDGIQTITQGQNAWQAGMGDKLAAMQSTEVLLADNIASRASALHSSAQRSALTFGIITVAVLLVVMLGAVLVARSLVRPLRRLRAGALNIASVQLPERVRLLSDNPDSASTMEVAPINVTTRDEIGQVARAFDQVHSEAVRLAGEQALLRSSFNAMFVNLSRRSQSLIERLARMIDNLEQTEDDPTRLGSLFSMDHLVTRMRRNSENLLLLAGHENPRKWSDPIPLADVARAATSEIEQYNRVSLTIEPGISVVGQAVSDVVHLLAELIENATIFSPKDTQVLLATRELTSGGVLIEITDQGIGVSESRLADMNWRLDNPPTIDVSVSRHMGLFAVARLAERHRVRVRLRPASPQGVSALVWLPDSVIERTSRSATGQWQAQAASAGLPVRTPRGNGASLPAGAGAIPAGGPSFGGGGGTQPVRSAEQVRSRLTGFQRGARRAEGQNGQDGHNGHNGHGGTPPSAGEGTMN